MNPRLVDGWIVIDTNASDHALVEIAVFNGNSRLFLPAFRDYENGIRVAKVRAGAVSGRVSIYTRIDGVETDAGSLTV